MRFSRMGMGRRTLLALAIGCCMQVALAQGLETQRNYDLPAGRLVEALDALSEQSGLQIVYDQAILSKTNAQAIRGVMTAEQALKALLQKQGLEFEHVSERTVRVKVATPSRAPAPPPPPPRQAQEAVIDLDKITVTGSHIRGVHASASPLLTFDREDIERSGYTSFGQFVESLPQNFGGGASQDTVGTDGSVGNDGFGSAANLRALGPGATLVLINGQRLASGGNSGQFVDISMIPLSAIQRVEVLTDGASALYGADAVGGVINVITRDDYEGAETMLRYGNVTNGDAPEVLASQSIAGSWATGNAMLVAEYGRQDPLRAGDRDFAFAADPDTTLLPQQRRNSVFGSISQQISGNLSVFGNLLYTRRDSEHEKVLLFPDTLHDRQTARNTQLTGLVGLRLDTDNWNGELVANRSEFSFDSELDREGEITRTDVDTDVSSIDARINGAIARTSAGDISVALGAGYRRENVDTIFDDVLPARDVHVAFGELFIPIVGQGNRMRGIEALELSIAGRYEKFSDFGSKLTPKYGIRWSPVQGLALRGTYGKSFKAPTMAQLAGGTESFLAFIPSDFGITVPGDPLILARTQAAQPDLDAEESTSWTAGFDVHRPGSPFRLSLSYYNIEMSGRISDPLVAGFDAFFNNPEAFGDLQVRNPSADSINQLLAGATSFLDLTGGAFSPDTVGLYADLSLTNLSSERQRGFDLETSYLFDTRWGQIDASLSANYITKFEKAVTSTSPAVNARNVLSAPVDFRLRGGGTWTRGAWTSSLFVNYTDDYRVSDEPGTAKIDSWTTFDANVRYALESEEGAFWHGLSFTVGVQNLFDRNPPYVATPVFLGSNPGYDPTNADPRGRFVSLTVAKSW